MRKTIAALMDAHPQFNRQTLSSTQLHEWIEKDLDIYCVADDRPPVGHKGVAYMWQGTRFILYESELPEAKKVLVITHELAHHLVGHCDAGNNGPEGGRCRTWGGRAKAERERQCDLIAYHVLIPDSEIRSALDRGNDVTPEWLRQQHSHLWAGLDDDEVLYICTRRLRIFRELWGGSPMLESPKTMTPWQRE